MSAKSLKDLNEILNARSAERISYGINPATNVETLTRAFWVNHDRYQESATHLNSYTDAKNCDPDTPAETQYVTNPDVGRSSSFVGKWVHSGCSRSGEYDKLLQQLTRVYDIESAQNLFDRPEIVTQDNSILNLFGIKESETDVIGVVIYGLTKESRTYCMDSISDQALGAQYGITGMEYEGRHFEVNAQDNTASLSILFRKYTNSAFNVDSPDLEWYSYKNTKKQIKHQLWTRVDKSDPLTNLYTGDTGYNVTTVSITEGQGGTINVQRTQPLEAKGSESEAYDEERTEVMRPHSLVSGTKYHVTVKNHRLSDPSTSYGTIDSSHTNYTLVDTSEQEESTGLWTKIYKYEKTVWPAFEENLSGYTTINIRAEGRENEQREKIWNNVSSASMDSAVIYLKATADNGYYVYRVSVTDNHDGSIRLVQTSGKAVNSAGREQTKKINAHSMREGIKTQISTEYWGFPEGSLPGGTNPTTSNDYILNDKKGPDDNGYYSRVNAQETVVWHEWDHVYDMVSYDNIGESNETRTRYWYGIRLQDQSAAVTACTGGTGLGAADAGYLINSVDITDNHNGSITVVQATGKTKSSLGFYDQTSIYLKKRREEVARISGGAEMDDIVARSEYGRLYSGSATIADELAWTWAKEVGPPAGYTRTTIPVFDSDTGVEITGSSQGYVHYVGRGVWEAIRIVYEES